MLLLLCACHAPITEALVTVSASGLQVGVDINRLHLLATDTNAGFTGLDQTVALCPGPAGCRDLPLSVVLYPGDKSPQDTIRVLIEGLRDETTVLANVATFTFTTGVRKRFDVVLYGTCLNRLDCSGAGDACGPDGMCVHIMPTMPDMAIMPADLSVTNDLGDDFGEVRPGSDLSGCGDPGEACCAGSTCNAINIACYNNTCQACGGLGQWCCPFDTNLCGAQFGCDDTFHCTVCGAAGQPCCANNTCSAGLCSLGTCQPPGCGNTSQPCCPNQQCATGNACVASSCIAAACGSGSPCCAGSYCASNNICSNGSCFLCGYHSSQECDSTPACNVPFQPFFATGTCELCEAPGYPCCGGANGVCSGGLTCSAGACN
jgi:hypothetical protein